MATNNHVHGQSDRQRKTHSQTRPRLRFVQACTGGSAMDERWSPDADAFAAAVVVSDGDSDDWGWAPPPAEQCRAIPAMCNYVMYGEIVYLKTPQRYILQRDQPQQHFRTVFHGFAFYCPELCLNLADKWTAINSLVQCRCIAWPRSS